MVGHLLVRLDRLVEERQDVDVPRIAVGGPRNRVGPHAGTERLRRVHAHRLGAENRRAVEPLLPDVDAGLPQRIVWRRQVRRRVVGDVLGLHAGRGLLRGELLQPLPSRGARRIERAGAAAARRCVNMLSSVTSPKSPEKMSMCVTPGNVSFVNCGKSSIVISPYFFFSSCDAGPPCPRLLKIDRIGYEQAAMRSSLSFSDHAAFASAFAPGGASAGFAAAAIGAAAKPTESGGGCFQEVAAVKSHGLYSRARMRRAQGTVVRSGTRDWGGFAMFRMRAS